jgi:DNA-directed RNA polymerase subunit RPC12/RpoP
MLSLADVLRRHGPAYVERYGAGLLPSHRRAMQAIVHCRTPLMGGHVAVCTQCGGEHLLFHSCRHRACPRCGHDATEKWVTKQRELLLPVPYFHVVFTLPAELRQLLRAHQTTLLPLLMRTAFQSLARLCADPHFLGGQIGALAVLHTWTRTLAWHPHVHMLVPGGGLAPDGRTWLPTPPRRKRFLVPVRALAKGFHGRFLHLARRALPHVPFPEIPWGKKWVVFAKPVVRGADKVLDYLGRYVHKTALSGKAIVGGDDRTVTFSYRDNRDHRRKAMTLAADEFLRRFLQHVPPKGLHRVRAFGLLHPARRTTLHRLQLLLAPRPASNASAPSPSVRPASRCPSCGQRSLRRGRRLSWDECIALARAAEAAREDVTHRARAPPSDVAEHPPTGAP